MDMISNLPLSIIETILCLLPIQEAARTSILCKQWRYHWIKIPKLEFNEDTFHVSTDLSIMDQTFDRPSQRKEMNKRCKIFYAIYQVLLVHEGPIHEFALFMAVNNSCVEIDHIIRYLSCKNTVSKFTIDSIWPYKLPLSFFSLSNLTDLYLVSCVLDYQPTFNGFGNLTTLYVEELCTSTDMLLHFLSSCPLLKTVSLNINSATMDSIDDPSLINLFESLPMVENLSIWFYLVECFVENHVPVELSSALIHLKYLCIQHISFIQRCGLPFLVLMIKSSPNLEKLKLEVIEYSWFEENDLRSFRVEDYSNIWLEHLIEFEIRNFNNGENELDLVKLILVKSPRLKKLRILLNKEVDKDAQIEILASLLRSPRESRVVQIIVGHKETN